VSNEEIVIRGGKILYVTRETQVFHMGYITTGHILFVNITNGVQKPQRQTDRH